MRKLNFLGIGYFLKVSETLSFTEAARELYISQPALSKKIRTLEEELGIRLFNRDTKQVELTEGGQILYLEWSDLLKRTERAIVTAKSVSENQSQKIRVGILEFEGVIEKIAPLLEKFIENVEETEVVYEIHGFNQLRKMLNNNEVDLIFSLNSEIPAERKDICIQPLYDVQLGIIVSKRNHFYSHDRLSVSELKNEMICIFSDSYSEFARESILAHLIREGVSTRRIKEFSNIRSMEMALVNNGGITLGYRSFFGHNERMKFFPISDEIDSHGLVIAWHKEKEKLISKLLQFCIEQELHETEDMQVV